MNITEVSMEDVINYATTGDGNQPVLTFTRIEDADYVHVRIDSGSDYGDDIFTTSLQISNYRYTGSGLFDGREYEFGEVPFSVLHAVADASYAFREFLVKELQP